VVFSPSLTFIAAVQVVATAKASLALTTAGIAVVVGIAVACVWLPLITYLIWPEQTAHRLGAFNAWLRAHGPLLLIAGFAVAGVFSSLTG